MFVSPTKWGEVGAERRVRVPVLPVLTFQNTGAGPFSGSLIALLHAVRGV